MADAVMFNGHRLLELHGGALHIPTFTYFPPVDTRNRFVVSPSRRRVTREQLEIPQKAPVVGTVANINPQKGIEYFIRCAAIVWRAMPETRFIVVGAKYADKREYNATISEEVEASGLPSDRLMFLGERSDVENYYPAMDVKLITSVPNSEGTTTTAIEAMACGVPVVATDVGAVSELVEDNVTGYVVPSLDGNALARATLNILQNTHLRARLSEEARAHACELFDITVCTDQHIQALETSISHHRRSLSKYRKLVSILRKSH
jgi:glycosyltransferase involved in cell wall biosynthesis